VLTRSAGLPEAGHCCSVT